jgi:hypothetical protein
MRGTMSDESLKSPAGERMDVPRERVELSMALRTLPDESGTERVPQGTLPPERMREVLRRLAENVYDSAEAQDVVARRVRKDLRLSTRE